MQRERAVFHLRKLIGHDLRPMAEFFGVTVWKNGAKHKGWAGNALEEYLGLPANSNFMADFGDWDLKLVSLQKDKTGAWKPKETIAIDMINPVEVLSDRFEDSHFYDKLRRLVVVGRSFESVADDHSFVVAVETFDADDPRYFAQIKADYQTIQAQIRAGGLDSLSGKLGIWIQARTKGPGNGSISRAFYARKTLVSLMLKLEAPAPATDAP